MNCLYEFRAKQRRASSATPGYQQNKKESRLVILNVEF
jgi:hypothetical protein